MSSARSADKSALQALKASAKSNLSIADREKAKELVSKAKSEIKDESLRAAFAKVSDYFLTCERMQQIGQPLPAPLPEILLLGRFGIVQTAELAWSHAGEAIAEYPLLELLTGAPSPRFFDSLVKRYKDLSARVLEMLNSQPESADKSAALDWLVQHGKGKEMAKIAPVLLSSRQRLPHLATHEQLLESALLRDKAGDLLRVCLRGAKENSAWRNRLHMALLGNPKLLAQFFGGLPKTLSEQGGDFAVELVEAWLPTLPKTPVAAREELSGSLVALVGGLIRQPKRKEAANRLLDAIARGLPEWIQTIETADDVSGLWLVARASDLAQSRKTGGNISHYGAGLLASAMEKAKAGFSAETLLAALALNLGMERIATLSESVSFDPVLHEDAVGGLFKGDHVTVRESGWRLDGQVVRRAKVIPPEPCQTTTPPPS